MDIQKEREAFESWWEGFHNGRQITCDYVEEDNSYSVGYANAQWVAWQAKAQAVPETKKFNLDEFLIMEEKLKSKGGIIKADLDRFIAYAEMVLEKAKTQAVPDTYTPIVLALEDVQSKIEKTSFLTMDAENESEVYAVDANDISAYIDELIEAQEPK